MDWKECTEKLIAKEVSMDIDLVNSLIKSSENKFYSASMLKLSDTTSSSIIVLYYDSLREIIEALAMLEGYKIYNHECYTAFLGSILHVEDIAERFDRVRKLRNSINYYAKQVSAIDARVIIVDMKQLINECKEMLLSKTNKQKI